MSATIDATQGLEEEKVGNFRSQKAKSKSWRRFLTRRLIFLSITILVLLSVLVGGAIFYYKSYTKTDAYKKKQEEKELVKTVSAVGAVLLLPSGRPAMFTIADADALSAQQAFFRGAINGDRLLIYKEAGKAILYSPVRHLIVNVGPITTDEDHKTAPNDSVKEIVPTKTQEVVTPKKK